MAYHQCCGDFAAAWFAMPDPVPVLAATVVHEPVRVDGAPGCPSRGPFRRRRHATSGPGLSTSRP